MRVLLLILQVAASEGGEPLKNVDFDLAKVEASAHSQDTIVVTGRTRNHRLRRDTPRANEPPIPRAELGLFGKVRGGVESEQTTFANGTTSKRAMVKIKVPF